MYEEIEETETRDSIGMEPAVTPSWQDKILDNCINWLEDLQEEPVLVETEEQPDLYSFYEELCVLRSEFKKNSRRSHETFHQLGEHLGEFKGVMTSLAQRLENLTKEQENTEFIARQGILLQIVEIHERMRRFDEKLKEFSAPQPPPGDKVLSAKDRVPSQTNWVGAFWRKICSCFSQDLSPQSSALSTSSSALSPQHSALCFPQHSLVIEGFFLTMSHFDEFLAGAGVRRTTTTGAPFDPSVMVAVGAVATDASPPHTVVEEISGGYLYGDHVLKLAKVTVSKQKEQ